MFLKGNKQIYLYLVIGILIFYLWQDKILLYDFLSSLSQVFFWLRETFSLVGVGDGLSVWIPLIIILCLVSLGIIIFPTPPYSVRCIVILALLLAHSLYIIFRTLNTLQFTDVGSAIVVFLVWFSEILIYFSSLALYLQFLFSSNRERISDKYAQDILTKKYMPSVDIFIPTYSEPIEMLRRTVIGCQAVEYSNKNVYILDDGNRSEVLNLAKEIGCLYITRSDNQHAKAGNINHALKYTQGDLIAFFDADCIPTKNFLIRTVGFFQEEEVALVSGAQAFYNVEMFNHNIMSLSEQSTFFRHSQSGKDKFNAMLCFGTCFIVRRKAMEKIGGIPTETLSEDWATGIKLQAKGYKTYMLNEILGAGAVAESMGEFLQQRVRWAQGTLQSLYSSTNPFTIKGLSFMQRFMHISTIIHYLVKPFFVFLVVLPLLYFFFGFAPFYISRNQFYYFFLPFVFLGTVTFSWICKEYTSKLTALVDESFINIPLSLAVIRTFLRPFGWRFRVTRKGLALNQTVVNRTIFLPLLVCLLLTIAGIIYGYQTLHWSSYSEELYYFIFFWALIRGIFLWIGIYAAFDLTQERKTARFKHKIKYSFVGEEIIQGETIDLSEKGVFVKWDSSSLSITQNSKGCISFKDLDIEKIHVRIVKINQASLTFAFEDLSLDQYRKLVEFLYCRPGQWDNQGNLDKKVLQSILKSFKFDLFFRRHDQRTF